MGETAAMTIDNLHEMTEQEVGVTDWMTVTQERIDLFADATDDRQWIHLDRERAEHDSPYKSTVAHGFLTLSLLSHLSRNVLPVEGVTMRVNYGLNRVRFPAPVRVNARIRGRFRLQSVKDFSGAGGSGADLTLAVTLELEGSDKPCCVAEWIVRYYR
ncbi:MAG: MaoC family dehydratase [Acidobacteriota bacterium]